MKVKKILASIMSAVMLCSTVNVTSFADATTQAVVGGISPTYENASRVANYLYISSNSAECASDCTGLSNVVKITVEQTLEKHSGWFWFWNEVDNAKWTKTVYIHAITMSNTRSGLTSGTYRLKSVFKLTNSSGKTETITIYSDEKKVS